MPAILPSRWIPPVHPPALMAEGVHNPYWRHFMMIPIFYGKILVRSGFTALQSDGETLRDMCEDLAYKDSSRYVTLSVDSGWFFFFF